MRIASMIIIVATGALFSWSLSWGADRGALKAAGVQAVDEDAPAFTVVNKDGQKTSLKDLKGRVVILHVWATWCKPCKEEFPLFDRAYRDFKDKGLEIIAVAIDRDKTRAEIEAAAKRLGGSFPVYRALDGDMTERYWAWGVPETYFIDKSGRIAGRVIGPKDWSQEGVRRLLETLLWE